MRVISGSAKGRKLKRVPGDSTRPIMDRVKENLFNIVGEYVPGSRWLDLFAGTGQVGIEALSRGAEEVVFVDSVSPAIRTIQANLQHTGLENRAVVVKGDAFKYLETMIHAPYDLIFVAPPQYQGLWLQALKQIDRLGDQLLPVDGMVVVQIDPNEEEPPELAFLEETDRRRYGSTLLLFYEPPVSVT